MKSPEISRFKIGPFSLACNDPYIGIWWENQSSFGLIIPPHTMYGGILFSGSPWFRLGFLSISWERIDRMHKDGEWYIG